MSIAEKLQLIAENEQKVFDAGKKAEYDAFWDTFQLKGARTAYDHAFKGWDLDLFYPKYDLICTKAMHLFYNVPVNANPETGKVEDGIATRLKKLGITLDVSAVTDVSSMFAYYKGVDVPYLDFSSATTANTVFAHANNIVTIEGIKVSESVYLYGSFTRCDKLENITFDGTIAKNLSFKDSPLLSLESLRSIVFALKDCYHQEDEWTHTITISKASMDKLDEETSSGVSDPALRYIQEKAWSLEVI